MRTILAVMLMPGGLFAAGGIASGTLTVQGHTMAMKHAYAMQIPDWFDKSKLGTRLIVSDVAIPAPEIQDEIAVMRLAAHGKINAIQFEFGAERSGVSISIFSSKLEGSLSLSRNFDKSAIPVFTAARIEGSLAGEPSKLGGMSYQFNVRFAADVEPRSVPATPTADETAAAAKAASAQAYLAFTAAVKSGNKARMLELASPDVRRMIDQPDFAKKLAIVQAMTPDKVQVLKATEAGDEGTLIVTGVQDGQARQGTVKMTRQDGKWFMVRESWRN